MRKLVSKKEEALRRQRQGVNTCRRHKGYFKTSTLEVQDKSTLYKKKIKTQLEKQRKLIDKASEQEEL